MSSKLFLGCVLFGMALLVSSAAQAYSITITYQGQTVIAVEEGETLTVPLFSSLDPEIQALITAAGYEDEYLKLEGTSLTVPTGCLDDDIVIAIDEANVPGAVVAFSFEVEGSQGDFDFSCLPKLELPYGSCLGDIDDEGALTVAFFENGSFTSEGISDVSVDTEGKMVEANIAHLSIIALTEGMSALSVPVMPLGGLALGVAALGLAGAAAVRRRR
jgi:archaellum component FlaF (FlaF/FlaG flagellin family)